MRVSFPSRTVVAVLAASMLAVAAGPAPSVPSADACDQVTQVGPRACATVDAGRTLAAGLCDQPGVVPADTCGDVRGVTVDPALVDAYAESDLAALHALQRDLGSVLPLAQAQVLSSHNSYNSSAYRPSVAGADPNHYYGLADQLRMDMREIELDVHTWYGPDADADGRLPVLCHATGPHIGCSADRPLADGLAEIRAWLDANRDQVIMIDVESHLDGLDGHDEAAAVVEAALGDLLHRPPADAPCAPLPLDTSFDDVRDGGAQVLLVSSCGTGDAWGGLVHTYGAWRQGRLGDFDADQCGGDYDRAAYDTAWTRYWEDTTWLSAMAGGPGPRLEGDVLHEAMACGLSLASLDRLHPEDPRLETLLWSWALDARPQDARPGDVAVLGGDRRMHVLRPTDWTALDALSLLCQRVDGSFEVATLHTALQLHAVPDGSLLDLLCGDGELATPRSARQMRLVEETIDRYEATVGPLASDVLLAYAVTGVDAAGGPVWTAG